MPDLSRVHDVGALPMTSGAALRDEIDRASPVPIAGGPLTLSIADLVADGFTAEANGKYTRGAYVVQTSGPLEDRTWFASWHAWRVEASGFSDPGKLGSNAGLAPSARRGSGLLVLGAIIALVVLAR